jgi:hypothetical protein
MPPLTTTLESLLDPARWGAVAAAAATFFHQLASVDVPVRLPVMC